MDNALFSKTDIKDLLGVEASGLNLYAVDLHFRTWCAESGIIRLLGERTSWAIIGGSVRKAVLGFTGDKPPVFGKIAPDDIDIAVSVPVETLPVLRNSRIRRKMSSITKNSFGGYKIVAPDIGTIDLWTWEHPGRGRVTASDWQERMSMIDYGLNAAIYAWPQDRVVLHERFLTDLRDRCVEVLNPAAPLRPLRAVRAAALAVQMEQITGCRFTLGPGAEEDIRWLLSPAEIGNFAKASAHLDEKIVTTRWEPEVRTRFFEECRRLGGDGWR